MTAKPSVDRQPAVAPAPRDGIDHHGKEHHEETGRDQLPGQPLGKADTRVVGGMLNWRVVGGRGEGDVSERGAMGVSILVVMNLV
jgi:hypothetical protein